MVQRWPSGEGSRVQYHQCHTRSIALWFQKSLCLLNQCTCEKIKPSSTIGAFRWSGSLSLSLCAFHAFSSLRIKTLYMFNTNSTAHNLLVLFLSGVSCNVTHQSLSWYFWQVYLPGGWSLKPHLLLYWWSMPFQRFPCCFRFPPRWGSIGLTDLQGSLYCCPVTVLG